MLTWLAVMLATLRAACRSQRELALENLALRQQLAALKFRHPRPRLTDADRLFWVLLARFWTGWQNALHIVEPETVLRWHRQGFRYYWRWKSCRRGRPRIDADLRALIRRMSEANPLWGAPRIHGELLKLGIEVAEATVSKYLVRRRGPPSQAWRTFLENHTQDLLGMDFLTVPTATFRVLFVLVMLKHDRRRLLHFAVTEHPTALWTARQLSDAAGAGALPGHLLHDCDAIFGAAFSQQVTALGLAQVRTTPHSPWQNPYAERIIGSIRRRVPRSRDRARRRAPEEDSRELCRLLRSIQNAPVVGERRAGRTSESKHRGWRDRRARSRRRTSPSLRPRCHRG